MYREVSQPLRRDPRGLPAEVVGAVDEAEREQLISISAGGELLIQRTPISPVSQLSTAPTPSSSAAETATQGVESSPTAHGYSGYASTTCPSRQMLAAYLIFLD